MAVVRPDLNESGHIRGSQVPLLPWQFRSDDDIFTPLQHTTMENADMQLTKEKHGSPRSTLPAEVVVLTTRQAANYVGLSVSTLNKWRCYGFGPKYLKLGRAVRYRQEELDRYLAGQLYQSTLEN